MILEASIRAAEHLEMGTPHQRSCVLNTRKALLKQMISSDIVSGDTKGKFQKIEGTADNVLSGKAILKRFKLLRRHMVSDIVPFLLPENTHEIPSGKHLWEAFDRICLALHKKQQKALLLKKGRRRRWQLHWQMRMKQ